MEYSLTIVKSFLQRLEATLFTMRNWASVRSNASLHNWHVKEFLLISQCDLHNAIDDCFKILQVRSAIVSAHEESGGYQSYVYQGACIESLCFSEKI